MLSCVFYFSGNDVPTILETSAEAPVEFPIPALPCAHSTWRCLNSIVTQDYLLDWVGLLRLVPKHAAQLANGNLKLVL